LSWRGHISQVLPHNALPMPPESLPLASIPLPVLLLDREGYITHGNEQALASLGLSGRRLVGLHLSALFAPDEAVQQLIERTIPQGQEISNHDLIQRRVSTPFSLHGGPAPEGAVMLLLPAANRQLLDQHVHHIEIAEAVARIALEMAHEVKNPLAALRGASQWLSEQTLPDGGREATDMMLSEIDRIRERIDAFLHLGPRAPLDMEAVNIHTLIDDVCVSGGDVEIVRNLDPSLPDVQAHPARLRHVFENLWRNALEAGATKVEWRTRIAVNAALPGKRGGVIEAVISDNGSGIPAGIRDHIFEPFVTDKERGSGLGLAIAQRVMLNHGGRIVLDPYSERTSFILQFPLAGH